MRVQIRRHLSVKLGSGVGLNSTREVKCAFCQIAAITQFCAMSHFRIFIVKSWVCGQESQPPALTPTRLPVDRGSRAGPGTQLWSGPLLHNRTWRRQRGLW